LSNDFKLLVYDINHHIRAKDSRRLIESSSLEAALSCQVVFYAVPIEKFEDIIKSHQSFFERQADPKLLIDVLSVKLFPKKIFTKYLPPHVSVLLTHPMFGPDTLHEKGLEGQIIVIDPFTASHKQCAEWKNYFEKKKFRVLIMDSDEHDKIAAYSQGVTHFIGRVMDDIQIVPTVIDTLGTKKLLEVKEQTCHDSWELFSGLQNKNPYTIDMRISLGKSVNDIYSKLLPNRIHQTELVVGIQGGRGSFNEEAAFHYLKTKNTEKYKLIYLNTTHGVLEYLHEAKVDRGQFAIHNSAGGIVQESIEASAYYRYKIIEQFSIKISHALMTRRDIRFDQVKTIMTHPQVIKQCQQQLLRKYPHIKLTSGEGLLIDHANVASQLAQGLLPPHVATIGSKSLARIYGLKLIEDNLQDLDENLTSFLWVERV